MPKAGTYGRAELIEAVISHLAAGVSLLTEAGEDWEA